MKNRIVALATLALAATAAYAQQQGVTKDEIVVGTIQDLSGPLAGYGKQARNGMQLRIDELNEQQGNINGRKIRLIAEDNGYDPKKAVLAAQKLVNQDKVWNWVEGHPKWTDPAEAARAFEADMVVFLEVEAFQIQDPHSPGLLEGTARTHIQAIELDYPKNSKGKAIKDQPKESNIAYNEYRDTTFPTRGPIPEGSTVSRGAFKNKFLQVVATEISWHFVEHSPEDDIQDARINNR